jgi:hypothetical protein
MRRKASQAMPPSGEQAARVHETNKCGRRHSAHVPAFTSRSSSGKSARREEAAGSAAGRIANFRPAKAGVPSLRQGGCPFPIFQTGLHPTVFADDSVG